ncbi:hypothetical protein C8Q74DRAFT_1372812 [Fomes fomentarius]|nr:hypothetical protein C8Q74DRAFT_1372812 [Fomes fomentarius]
MILRPSTSIRGPLTHSYYAIMGGFVLQDPHSELVDRFLPLWQRNGVLSEAGVRFLMKHEPALMPDLPLAEIVDKSKAGGVAKAPIARQVLWFCLNCLVRLAQGLPLPLLAAATIADALCALLTYTLWWKKPKVVAGSGLLLS